MTINFQDQRVIRRCKQAIEFSVDFFGNKNKQASRDLLQEHFGKSNNPISKYLRQMLLLVVDEHYNMSTGKCKTYKLNIQGLNYIEERLANTYTDTYKNYQQLPRSTTNTHLHQTQLKNSQRLVKKHLKEIKLGKFKMLNKSSRSFHPLQNIPSMFRGEILRTHGYNYDYDIQCCAPTLLVQLARRKGMTKSTPACDFLLNDRQQFRNQISSECNITPDVAKQIINALFQGGKLSQHYSCNLYTDVLNYNTFALHRLQRCLLLCQLRREISMMWRYIGQDIARGVVELKSGLTRRRALSPKKKAQIYRELERCVRVEIERYLKKNMVRYLFEHDGWRCDQMIDLDYLIYLVRSKTGYDIRVDVCIL